MPLQLAQEMETVHAEVVSVDKKKEICYGKMLSFNILSNKNKNKDNLKFSKLYLEYEILQITRQWPAAKILKTV